ncbi:hypothetical protein UA08_03998 [Talaromyces atroroseus]|uniref:Zn(2)-C6 fungal-type domain-containing protein n=1 Tax=Talaromyces atroroseus TaxID=1441469 RepID=A0A1Q5Q8J9_TALAT|nr:hypothetical protein UA08_03998 [Talaromyces atroroseus]OKL60434.1 hypothetical protein UA08_03998 [Talaromyces atroroseus]
MTKGCYTCRRRRIVCDNGHPTCRKCRNAGKECLGYQKPLVWVKGGVASRGKMMGLSFDDVVDQGSSSSSENSSPVAMAPNTPEMRPRPTWPSNHGDGIGAWAGHQLLLSNLSGNQQHYSPRIDDATLVRLHNAYTESPMYSLVDPLFQDLSRMERFYINIFSGHCVKWFALYDAVKNPYRELFPYISNSPLLANSLAAIGAIEFAYMSNDDGQSVGGSAKPDMALVKPLNSQAYEHFLRFKQRALRQLSTEVSRHPLTRIDDRTLAAIFVLILLNMIESGDTAWMYHLEGAKNILRGRLSDVNSLPLTSGIESFVVDSCLITEIMGSTLARPGVLSRPFYSPGMGTAVLKRLERTLWVGCPAYLLDAIFFVHAQRYSEPGETAEYSLSFLSPSGEATRPESPLAILRHIDTFDPYAWAEDMQSYLALPDLSQRIALARAYKAAVYLYARRVVSKMTPTTTTFSSDRITTSTGTTGPLRDRRIVENELLQNLSFISPDDEHFKCLIWPTFIAGAESTSIEQRMTTLRLLGSLWNGFYSFNLQSAASVLKVMWDKQDERQRNRQAGGTFLLSDIDESIDVEEGFDWIRELDQSSTDWLFI